MDSIVKSHFQCMLFSKKTIQSSLTDDPRLACDPVWPDFSVQQGSALPPSHPPGDPEYTKGKKYHQVFNYLAFFLFFFR